MPKKAKRPKTISADIPSGDGVINIVFHPPHLRDLVNLARAARQGPEYELAAIGDLIDDCIVSATFNGKPIADILRRDYNELRGIINEMVRGGLPAGEGNGATPSRKPRRAKPPRPKP